MLPNNLTTSEVKDSAGTAVPMNRWDAEGRSVEFAKVGEAPNAENHLKVSHQEVGSGVDTRRRSACIVTLQKAGISGKQREFKFSLVGDIPIGDISDYTDAKTCLAELMSFVGIGAAGTTLLYNCTGVGADAIINGTT